MSKVFIIHGAGGSPKANWFPWLKEELEKSGHIVFVPKFPKPENQSLESWMAVFNNFYIQKLDEDSIFVGHSLGPSFILSILEKLEIQAPLKASFLVAGFVSPIGDSYFDKINKTFINKHFNWEKIKNNCRKFYVLNSDSDPYVSIDHGKELAEKLETDLITLENAGHINKDSGYTKFDYLLSLVKKELN